MLKKQGKKDVLIQTPSKETFILFSIGIILFVSFILYQIYRSSILSFSDSPQIKTVNKDMSSIPKTIQFLPSQYSLEVDKTYIQNGRWQIATKGASYLLSSARPGEKGSIIIYGHNTKDRFGILRDVKIGDTVSIKTKNGQLRSYVVKEKLTVKPSNTSVLNSADRETLILYTCTGFADTKRLVVKALPL